jgi:signal transduction histidine kinase
MAGRPAQAYDQLVTGTLPTQATPRQALAARAAAWYSALPPKRRERVQDAGLAIGLALLNLVALVPYTPKLHPAWLAFFLAVAQCLPLAWRRKWPVPVLIVLAVPRVWYDVLGFGYAPMDLAPAIAFATVIDRSRRSLRWLSVLGTVIGNYISQSAPGQTEPYNAITQAFIFGTAWVIGTLNRTRREAIAATTQRAERAEAGLDAAAARAADAERVRIARELHDVVAHHVSLMAVQAEAAGALLPGRPDAASRAADLIAETARQALTELRRLLGVIRSPTDISERPGLSPAGTLSRLEEVLDHMRDSGLPVSLTVSGAPATVLPPGVDLSAYRIVQEALTNTIRHAPGAKASVGITYEDSAVTINVQDTGKSLTGVGAGVGAGGDGANSDGADGGGLRAHPDLSHGFGLAGIAERVASCGGTLTVGPVPRGGFAVTARLPVR